MLLENFVKKQEFKVYDKFNLWKCKNSENYYFNFKIEEGNIAHEYFIRKISNYLKENTSSFDNHLCLPLDTNIKIFTESTDIDGIKKREEISLDKLKEILFPGIKINFDLGIDLENNLKITQLIVKKISNIFMQFDSDRKYIEASISLKINNQEKEEIKISNVESISKDKEYKFESAELVETNIDGFIYPKIYN